MKDKTDFKIEFPLNILEDSKEVNFENKNSRDEIFKRNIYYFNYDNKKNGLLEQRSGKYFSLAHKVIEYIGIEHPELEVLSVSLFGSSLYLQIPGDFDFLTIVKGRDFLLEEPKLRLNGNDIQVGMSIKGADNFTNGFRPIESSDKDGFLEQIINRTAVSLFRRHIPIIGQDFINNSEIFLVNIYAQVSDLCHNTFNLYYLKNNKKHFSEKVRSRKILSRMYEAVSYLEFKNDKPETHNLKKKIYLCLNKETSLSESKKIFDSAYLLYKKGISGEM